jgi:hypothetical protein
VFFQRHQLDDPTMATPGRDALRAWPVGVQAKADRALIAVAEAPPHKFAGGGYWEAMHGEMSGYFELRVTGPNRHHYRLFCLLDTAAEGQPKGLLAVIAGNDKKNETVLTAADYRRVKALGDEYLSRNPRSIR